MHLWCFWSPVVFVPFFQSEYKSVRKHHYKLLQKQAELQVVSSAFRESATTTACHNVASLNLQHFYTVTATVSVGTDRLGKILQGWSENALLCLWRINVAKMISTGVDCN